MGYPDEVVSSVQFAVTPARQAAKPGAVRKMALSKTFVYVVFTRMQESDGKPEILLKVSFVLFPAPHIFLDGLNAALPGRGERHDWQDCSFLCALRIVL